VLPPLSLAFYLYGRASKAYVGQQLAASAKANAVAEETLGSIRTVGVGWVVSTLGGGGGLGVGGVG
jgi:hypothetical protein